MTADQLRRAAEEADRIAFTTDHGSDVDVLVAALLRAAADWPRPDTLHFETPQCRKRQRVFAARDVTPPSHDPLPDLPCRGCALDDVAAAYLAEEPQP